MNRHSRLALLLTASLGATAAITAPNVSATAGPDSLQIESETVRYDADAIRDQRAAKHLFMRIRQAAEQVCRISSFPRGYEMWYEHDCASTAVDRAVRDAALPALDAYYFDELDEAVASPR